MNKVGAFVCTGCDIGQAIDVGELEEPCSDAGADAFITHECLCSPEGLAKIREAIADGTDGVVIAACSPRSMTSEFAFDRSEVAIERVSLREQVAWTHPHGDEDTQMLAADLMRMGVAKAQKVQLPVVQDDAIERTVLVVGGGLTGLNAARAAVDLGHPVVLVEKQDRLGGHLAKVKEVPPQQPPYDQPQTNGVAALVAAVEKDDRIRILKSSSIVRTTGQPGQFQVEVKNGSGSQSLMVGSIVQATGARPYDAAQLEHLAYGKSPDVVTSHQLESMLVAGELKRPSDGKQPQRVVFLQCSGSRDERHLPYCSSECCSVSLKQASVIVRDHSGVQPTVVFRDLRAPGQLEHLYAGMQDKGAVRFVRGEVEQVSSEAGELTVQLRDGGGQVQGDLIVLAVGMVPCSADGEAIRKLVDAKAKIERKESDTQVAEATQLAESLKEHEGTEILHLDYRQGPDLPTLGYSFPDSHYICFPYETRRTGIYAAGTLRAPMHVAQAEEDGWGAAMKAVQCIEAASRHEAVHPRAGDVSLATFALQRCTQCKRCTEECPFGTLNEDEKGTPQYNALRCRRCGICLGACPERIVSFPEYSVDAVASMIKAMDVPEEDEEKPRILAFVCENDALPALDEAAARRMGYNPWVRVIPVRCLGAVNVVWIADSLSSGIDGVLLLGCRKGDDYQCHYIRGSELAEYRMGNVQETLQRLQLEADRIRVEEIARDDFARIPLILDEFAETIDRVGPNPYKGF
jgi:quinone-modifying oxidoreductase, subunit QmoB